MSKILIVGGSGFLGSHVADRLSEYGHTVVIYDIKRSPYLRSDQEMIVGDIQDYDQINSALSGMEYVYNFACIADIKEAAERPLDTVQTNIVGHANLLEACCANNVKRYIYASTVYIYSNSGSIYRASKQSAELLIDAYSEQFGLKYTIVRLGTLYGPRAPEWNGFYQLMMQAITTGRVEYNGSGREVREFIHVYDAAESCIEVLDPQFTNAHIIICGQDALKGHDFVELLCEIFDGKLEVDLKYKDKKRPGHYVVTPYLYKPSIARRLNRKTYIDLGQGILEYLHELRSDY